MPDCLALALDRSGEGARIEALPVEAAVAERGFSVRLRQLVSVVERRQALVSDQQEGQGRGLAVALEDARLAALELEARLHVEAHALELEGAGDRGVAQGRRRRAAAGPGRNRRVLAQLAQPRLRQQGVEVERRSCRAIVQQAPRFAVLPGLGEDACPPV